MLIFLALLALGAYVSLIVGRWRDGFKKLGFKEGLSSLVRLGSMVWVVFFILASLMVFPNLMDILKARIASGDFSESSITILENWLPLFFLFNVLLIPILLLKKVWSRDFTVIGYTKKEKEYMEEDDKKLKDKVRKIPLVGGFIK